MPMPMLRPGNPVISVEGWTMVKATPLRLTQKRRLVSTILMDSSPVGDRTPAKLRQLQLDDPSLKFVLDAKESNQRPSEEAVKVKGPEVRKLVQIWDPLVMVFSSVDSKTRKGRQLCFSGLFQSSRGKRSYTTCMVGLTWERAELSRS